MKVANAQIARIGQIATVLGAWTLLAILFATQAWFSEAVRGEPITWIHAFGIWLAWAYAWALLTPLVFRLVARHPIGRLAIARSMLVHGIASVVFAAINLAIFAWLAPCVDAVALASTWLATFVRLLSSTFLLNLPVYWLLLGAAQLQRIARAARERERNALQLESQLAEAKLLVLRAQLQPHFLFNALNTISVLMREDVEAADRVLLLLSSLLRRALDVSTFPEVELRDEMAFLAAYLEIEQTRFGDHLSYSVAVAPELLTARVPSLILQPLVENAVRHGLAARSASGRIEIAAESRAGMLQLQVRDNGVGMAVDRTEGVGLANTRSRLQLAYGDRQSFSLRAAVGGGVVATLTFPLRMNLKTAVQSADYADERR
jgi:two-component system, LytTR family, sensor kinase